MHHKYNTEAIVLGSISIGEADKLYWLFTHELGLVLARAQSARAEKSRMRCALQDFSIASIGLVEGKHGWRVAGAIFEKQLTNDITAENIKVAYKIIYLLKRYIPEREKDKDLFVVLREGFEAIFATDDKNLDDVETLFVAKILFTLGYLQKNDAHEILFKKDIYKDVIDLNIKKQIVKSINNTLAESHL